jgi:hypothetical protein
MFLVPIEGQSGDPPFLEWKANSKGLCRNLEAALCRDARAVMPRAPLSLRICVHDRIVDPQKSSHTERMLRPIYPMAASSPALGKEVGMHQIFLEIFSRKEST